MFSKSVFPHLQNIKAGELPQPDFQDDYNLGDIFLGVEYIFQQCKGDEDYYDILTVSEVLKEIGPEKRALGGTPASTLSHVKDKGYWGGRPTSKGNKDSLSSSHRERA